MLFDFIWLFFLFMIRKSKYSNQIISSYGASTPIYLKKNFNNLTWDVSFVPYRVYIMSNYFNKIITEKFELSYFFNSILVMRWIIKILLYYAIFIITLIKLLKKKINKIIHILIFCQELLSNWILHSLRLNLTYPNPNSASNAI